MDPAGWQTTSRAHWSIVVMMAEAERQCARLIGDDIGLAGVASGTADRSTNLATQGLCSTYQGNDVV